MHLCHLEVSAPDDGVCRPRTQLAPSVVPSSPTPWEILDISVDAVSHTVHRSAELPSASEREVPSSRPHSSRNTPSSSVGGHSGCCAVPTTEDVCKAELSKRSDQFGEGLWTKLHRDAELDAPSPSRKHTIMTTEQKGRAEEEQVRVGEVSRARQCLTGAAVAPGNDTTFQNMQRKRPQFSAAPLPQEVLNFEPEVPVHLDTKTILASLKSAPRGPSPGPGG